MAKKSIINRNKKRIALNLKFANKRNKLKKIVMNKKLSLEERFKAQMKLSKLPRNSSKIRVKNRCEITGRSHGVYRKLKISRIALRQLSLEGKVPGMVKSSWWERNEFMSFTDPIGDMITRIRNGQMRSHVKIEMPASTFKGKILEILKREGFILNYSLDQVDEKKTKFTIDLKYNSGSPVINNIERISKPGRRFYSSAQSIPRIRNGLGIAIVSTSRGVMTDSEARKAKIGGEIICRIF